MILTFRTTEMRIILDSLWSLSQASKQMTEDIETKRNNIQRRFEEKNVVIFLRLLTSFWFSFISFIYSQSICTHEKSLDNPLSNYLFLSIVKSVVVAYANRARVKRKSQFYWPKYPRVHSLIRNYPSCAISLGVASTSI